SCQACTLTPTLMTRNCMYLAFSPDVQGDDASAVKAICDCIMDLRKWMIRDRLMLHDDKTEFLLLGTKQKLDKVDINRITAVHGIAPTYIQNLVSLKSKGTYNLRSSSGFLLASLTFRTKVTQGDRSFQVAAPKLRNALPRELRDIPDLHTFKSNIKTYLFKFAHG
ncbi:unnamed protein product, partial [Porites evermanni]